MPPPSWSSSRRNNRTGISVRICTSQAQTHTPLLLLFMICVYFSSSCSFMSLCWFNASKLVVKCIQRTTATSYFTFDEFAPTKNIHFAEGTKTKGREEKKKTLTIDETRTNHTRHLRWHTNVFSIGKDWLWSAFQTLHLCRQHTKLLWNCIASQQPTNPLEQREHLALIKKKKKERHTPISRFIRMRATFFLSSFALWIYVVFSG